MHALRAKYREGGFVRLDIYCHRSGLADFVRMIDRSRVRSLFPGWELRRKALLKAGGGSASARKSSHLSPAEDLPLLALMGSADGAGSTAATR